MHTELRPDVTRDTVGELCALVQRKVSVAMADFSALTGEANRPDVSEVSEFADRLGCYALQLGSMRRTRIAGHAAHGLDADDDSTLEALGSALAALEMFHAAALIHDDILDDSTCRRGSPAFHVGWSSAETAAAAGILGGDALLVLSASAVDSISSPARDRVASFFREAQLRTIVGELQDSVLAQQRTPVERAAITQMSVNKTAWYTVTAPIVMSWFCGGRTESPTGVLAAGSMYGEAFQLLDDLTEIFIDPRITGKSPTDDLRSGKATLLHHLVDSHCDDRQRERLHRVYGAVDGGESELAQYRRLVTECGGEISTELRKLMREARARLQSSGFDSATIDNIESELFPREAVLHPKEFAESE